MKFNYHNKTFTVLENTVNGEIKLMETWEWTSGDFSSGESVIVEVD